MSRLIDIDLHDENIIKLSQDQIEELEMAIAQIEKGEFITHEEAKKQSITWLED